jgi:hypothetical protein
MVCFVPVYFKPLELTFLRNLWGILRCSVLKVLSHIIKWFGANKLLLNLDKTNIVTFVTKNSPHPPICIGHKENFIKETMSIKFLGLQIDNHLNWKNHIELIIPKLSGVCYAVRSMVPISDITTLKSIYFAYFHSIIKYGIIFWGNSSYSTKIFILQKNIIRILADAQPTTSCRSLFKKLQILPIQCQYINQYWTSLLTIKKLFRPI